MTDRSEAPRGMGNRIAPARFVLFVVLAIVGVYAGITFFGWRHGTMVGFDLAALVFLLSCVPLLNDRSDEMRELARRNDANRAMLLVISVAVSLAVLVAVAAELSQKGALKPLSILLVVATLALAWIFSNTIYALHYAHIAYGDERGRCLGLDFPGTPEPDYWDFVYFAFTCGMAFATSDVQVTSKRMRRLVTVHSLAAFAFNIGVLAFTINVLGS